MVGLERQETDQENQQENNFVIDNPNIKMNFDNMLPNDLSDEDDDYHGGKKGNNFKKRRPSFDRFEPYNDNAHFEIQHDNIQYRNGPSNEQSRQNSFQNLANSFEPQNVNFNKI